MINTRDIPLNEQIRDWLLTCLAEGNVGDRLPSEPEIARRFRASRPTVHQVVARMQREGLVVRERGRGTFIRQKEARVMAEREHTRRGRVVVAYNDWFSWDFWSRINEAERLARGEDWDVVRFLLNRETNYHALLEMVRECPDAQGVVILPYGGWFSWDKGLDALDDLGIPVVILSGCDGVAATKHVAAVGENGLETGLTAGRALLERGYGSVAYVANEPWGGRAEAILSGLRRAWTEAGAPAAAVRVTPDKTAMFEDSAERGAVLTRSLWTDADGGFPSALVFDSIPGAVGGLRTLRAMGVDPAGPDAPGLVALGEHAYLSGLCTPALTTCSVSAADYMEAAFSWLHKPAVAGREVLLKAEWRERESTPSRR